MYIQFTLIVIVTPVKMKLKQLVRLNKVTSAYGYIIIVDFTNDNLKKYKKRDKNKAINLFYL